MLNSDWKEGPWPLGTTELDAVPEDSGPQVSGGAVGYQAMRTCSSSSLAKRYRQIPSPLKVGLA